jgi:hypothetical protein
LTQEGRELALAAEAQRRKLLAEFLVDPKTKPQERIDFYKKCEASPAYFFKNVLWTKDPEQRMGCGTDLPLIPYNYILNETKIPHGYFYLSERGGGWVNTWHRNLLTPGESRTLLRKPRRALLSISLTGFYTWAMRFYPGFLSWLSSVGDGEIDSGDNFKALLGKMRYMWKRAHEFYPWLYPELPRWGSSNINKELYIQFPRWEDGDRKFAPECWDNATVGARPSEVAERGGGFIMGIPDEAAWFKDLEGSLENLEESTPNITLCSTAGKNPDVNPFEVRSDGTRGYKVFEVTPLMNPMMMDGAHFDPDSEDLISWMRQIRSPHTNERLERNPRDVFERNVNGNPKGTAGSRVLSAFSSKRNVGSKNPASSTFDLRDPRWTTEIWYDAGRGDPWACWWVQVSEETGDVHVVDFWMRSGVTIEWWIPLWMGWNPATRDHWITQPQRLPWRDQVIGSYGPDDLAVMKDWFQYYSQPGVVRPTYARGGSDSRAHGPVAKHSVESLLQVYGIIPRSQGMSHKRQAFIDHANLVMPRVKIAGRIADRRPISGGRTYPSATNIFLNWEFLPPTPRGMEEKPAHDINSHGGTAFLNGSHHLPARVERRWDRRTQTLEVVKRRGRLYTAKRGSGPGTFSGPGPHQDRWE